MLFREQNSIKLVLRGHKNLNQSAFRQKAVFIDEKSAEGGRGSLGRKKEERALSQALEDCQAWYQVDNCGE